MSAKILISKEYNVILLAGVVVVIVLLLLIVSQLHYLQ